MTPLIKFLFAPLLLLFVVSPAMAQQTNIGGATYCNKSVIYDASTNGATQLIAAGANIQICGFVFFAGGTVSVDLIRGTGTNCATNPVKLTPAFPLTAQTGLSDPSPFFRGMGAPVNTEVCINTNAGVAVQAIVYYAQGPS